jgi:hypothetical protein
VSSTSSATRQERSTRSHNKAASPQKSATPQSLTSSEEAALLDESQRTRDSHRLRRSKRTHEHEVNDNDGDDDADAQLEELGDDEIIEDEETTRCLCGQQEYPGQPVDLSVARSAKGSHPPNSDESGEERGGLFIQCDGCLVWQHGGCVSVMEESAVPDKYFCEECKPELHELLKAPNG